MPTSSFHVIPLTIAILSILSFLRRCIEIIRGFLQSLHPCSFLYLDNLSAAVFPCDEYPHCWFLYGRINTSVKWNVCPFHFGFSPSSSILALVSSNCFLFQSRKQPINSPV